MLIEEKYKNAILYFVCYCQNNFLGSTKLNKLLYYLDFVFYRDHNKTVTGDIYRRLDYGPVGKNVQEMLSSLKREGRLDIDDSRINGEYDPIKFVAKYDVNLDIFDKKERDLLKTINDTFLHYSTSRIINQTHAEAPCLYTEMYQDIDYNLSEDIDVI